MAHSTFRERFGYALWLAHLRLGRTPKFTAIAAAVGRTQPAVSAWLASDEPPPDYRVHAPLASYFEVDELWLVRDEGEPPEPDLWEIWIRKRRGAKYPAPRIITPDMMTPVPRSKPAKRRRAR